jgi:hypothetical protein
MLKSSRDDVSTAMRFHRTARALVMTICAFACSACSGAGEWRVMPAGFQTMAFFQPAAPSTVSGTFRIEREGSSSLDLAVDLMNLDPGRSYVVHFRPAAWCEPNVGVGQFELPRQPSPDPAMADLSWVGPLPAFAADVQGRASVRLRVPGRIGIDWYRVTVVVSPADRAQDAWLACGKLGTVRLGGRP